LAVPLANRQAREGRQGRREFVVEDIAGPREGRPMAWAVKLCGRLVEGQQAALMGARSGHGLQLRARSADEANRLFGRESHRQLRGR
jgi:hypothetical protein